ncbi:MAG: hypothetical protein ACI9UT_002740 [Flavobacteriales bacterium]|jgi:hypothetical protein
MAAGFNGCQQHTQKWGPRNSSIQTVVMGKFNGLRIIEIASLNYLKVAIQTEVNSGFNECDKENFSDSLIQSLQNSDVIVLASAQTKIHIDFNMIVITEDIKGIIMTINADVAVSRNGIITRKVIEVDTQPKITFSSTTNNAITVFIQKLGHLIRQQSTFKR